MELKNFAEKTFFITGASGLIGMDLINILMHADLGVKVYAVCRNEERARERFAEYLHNPDFHFIKHDINLPVNFDVKCDYIIHGASNTHPLQYSTDPIGTIATNVIGTRNILEFAVKQEKARVMFLSSVEIYGENKGDIDGFDENYCGYINCNTLRAGYPESKRLGEALCQAYIKSYGLDIVIPRLSRVYGPTMLKNDSKAISQFIRKAVNKEDIVLKSKGNQFFSYTYVTDAVTALLTILDNGKCGEAYNICSDNSDITLKYLAEILADISNKKVIFELPDEVEKQGYSTATKAILDNSKLKSLGWVSEYDILTGLKKTIEELK